MFKNSVFGSVFALGVLTVSGCVHVIEKEVLVEKPVYIEMASANTCSSGSRGLPANTAESPALQMRGSAGSLTSLPAAMLVVTQIAMGIGPGMSLDERAVLETKVQTVLETSSDGSGVRWVSAETGTVVDFVARDSFQEKRLVTVARGEEVGRLPESLVVEPAIYVTTQSASLRPTPSATSLVTGGDIPAGSRVNVLGRVAGLNSDSWLLVGGPDGTAFGYLEPAQLRPNETNRVHPREIYTRITGARIRDSVSASVMCRTLSYGSGEFDNVMRTCREPGGRWINQPPVVNASGTCRAGLQPSFLLDDGL